MKIFMVENLVNGKKYIGKQVNDKPSYMGSGIILKAAIKKYGKENFRKEILEYCNTKEELNAREIYWIDRYDAVNSDMFYNLALGGQGGDLSQFIDFSKLKGKKIHSEKYLKELSEKMKGDLNPMKGKTHTPEVRKKISEAHIGRKRTFTDEHCANLKKAQLNRAPISDATREKMSAIHKGSTHKGVELYQINSAGDIINVFQSIREASNKLNIPYKRCAKIARGDLKWQKHYDVILKRTIT